jgi:RNA polymerase sigma-70 factor (ECF subfamily)
MELLKRAQEAEKLWPGVDLPAEEFRDILGDGDAAASALHHGDFYLARACARRKIGAIAAFERVFLSQVPKYLGRMRPTAGFVEEVQQRLREKLFVGPPPKIGEYSGHGPLGAWVRVAALRTAIDLKRKRGELDSPVLTAEHLADTQMQSVDIAYLKSEYRHQVAAAFREGLERLSGKQRNLLRLHLLDELTLEQIAGLFSVGQSTVFRWLQAAREELVDHARLILRQRIGVTAEEFESLVQLVRSQLDLSLSQILRASTTADFR